ncbi:MAG: FAD-binding oxidoreductase, partial [Afipia sp.]|nr:FAD-binding oxidoreductase [Afipia sp.]
MTALSPLSAELLARFRAIVGDKHAIMEGDEKAPYLVEERGLYQGHSPLILRPGTTGEVAAICKLATETRTPLVPQGGNTGLVGGQIPHHGEILLSLRRLDKVREVDPSSNTMICESGVILANAHVAAEKAERIFPLWLGSEGSCTIGGNLSTNA